MKVPKNVLQLLRLYTDSAYMAEQINFISWNGLDDAIICSFQIISKYMYYIGIIYLLSTAKNKETEISLTNKRQYNASCIAFNVNDKYIGFKGVADISGKAFRSPNS